MANHGVHASLLVEFLCYMEAYELFVGFFPEVATLCTALATKAVRSRWSHSHLLTGTNRI